jgi:hypothetical protein
MIFGRYCFEMKLYLWAFIPGLFIAEVKRRHYSSNWQREVLEVVIDLANDSIFP